MPRALAYASLKNHLTTADDLRGFGFISWGAYKKGNEVPGQSPVKRAILNRILHQTNVKRACCRNKSTIDVRIPIPKDEIQDLATKYEDTHDIFKKYQYFDVDGVDIPPSMCPNDYKPGETKCNNFYSVYCANVLDMYKKQLKSKHGDKAVYNHDEFVRYKPECACYGDISTFDSFPSSFPRKCVFGGCGEGKKSYLDPSSLNTSCSLTVCKNIIDASNSDTGGGLNVQAQITNNCGNSLPDNERAKLNKYGSDKNAKTETKAAPKTETKAAPKTETKAAPKTETKPAPKPDATTTTGSPTIGKTGTAPAANNTMMYAAGGGGLFLCCCCTIIIIFIMMK